MKTNQKFNTIGHAIIPPDPEKFFAACERGRDEYFQLTPLISGEAAGKIINYRSWYIDPRRELSAMLSVLGKRHGACFCIGFEYSPVIFAYLPTDCSQEAIDDLLSGFALFHPDESDEYTGRVTNTGIRGKGNKYNCLSANISGYLVWRFWWD